MNIEQKEHLEQRKKEIENNILLLECKEALGVDGKSTFSSMGNRLGTV